MLAEAVDIRRWLREDRSTPHGERLQRDRAIGRDLPAQDELGRILGWWRRIREGSVTQAPGEPTLGARVEAARRLGSAALLTVGALLGAAVAAVAFAYDGRAPINLFAVLGVLVGIPLLLLIFTLLLIPGRIPGLRALQGVAAGVNVGRWFGAWLDRLLGAELFAPRLLAGGASAFSRWQLVVFSQWLALGFYAGALAVALLRVTFTDLAFGWGTTLQIDPDLVQAWTRWVSAPWAPWLPQAVPDAQLVEASRIYRLERIGLPPERVELLGRWWPFVLMTLLVYGALPRLLLMLIGAWRLRRATRDLLRNDPEVTALLDRLDAPLVRLERRDEEEGPVAAPGEAAAPPREAATGPGLLLLIWNGAVTAAQGRAWLVDNLGCDAAAVAEVGILQREQERRAVLAAAGDQVKPVRRVIVLTKGWEPPLLEFVDFLGLLRSELGDGSSITVVPLDVAGAAVPVAGREVWARALARVADPRLYVVEATP